jgi:large subunit ribosomal protein L33
MGFPGVSRQAERPPASGFPGSARTRRNCGLPAVIFGMAKGKKKLEVIHLVCEETGDHNYTLRRKSGGEKLKVKKYSPRLRKHTLHLEKKK